MENRDTFIMYRSFYNALKELDDTTQASFFRAICEYGFDLNEPNFTGWQNSIWQCIKPQLSANWKRFANGCKGGAPKGNFNAVKNNQKTTKNNQKQPNNNNNNNNNVNNNENVCVKTHRAQAQENTPTLKQRKELFFKECLEFRGVYDETEIIKFFDYWSEETNDKQSMRFELEKTWQTEKRLERWINNA